MKKLNEKRAQELLEILQLRFEKNNQRHPNIEWTKVEERLKSNPEKLSSLNEMELSGGEPDIIEEESDSGEYVFFDCSKESPSGRRSLCYDRDALELRKKFKPKDSAMDVANDIGVDLLTEEQYRHLQDFGPFDTKTSSWIKTPEEIRALGGALFCDFRYGTVFRYHNGADSYYASRGFRASLRV